MAELTPFVLTKRLETAVLQIVGRYDLATLDRTLQHQIRELKRTLVDARLDVRDYDLAETRAEQQAQVTAARQRLEQTREQMLLISQADMFGPVDIAQFSAAIDQIQALLT